MALDSAGGGGGRGATVVVVAMEGETGSATFITECISTGSEIKVT